MQFPAELSEKLTKARQAKVTAVRAQSAVAESIQADQVANDARHEVMQAVADWLDGPVEDEPKPEAKPKGGGKGKKAEGDKPAAEQPAATEGQAQQ